MTAAQHDRRQEAEEARWAAIGAEVRAEVAAWPPLTEQQRERLRVLLDLRGEPDGTP
jgi:hypothetical protein